METGGGRRNRTATGKEIAEDNSLALSRKFRSEHLVAEGNKIVRYQQQQNRECKQRKQHERNKQYEEDEDNKSRFVNAIKLAL